MSQRYIRHQLLAVSGVRRATYDYRSSAWRVSVWTSDLRQTEPGIASRFRSLGRVQSCTAFPAKDPAERRYDLVIVIVGRIAPAPTAEASIGGRS